VYVTQITGGKRQNSHGYSFLKHGPQASQNALTRPLRTPSVVFFDKKPGFPYENKRKKGHCALETIGISFSMPNTSNRVQSLTGANFNF
jgi:hypothetical protein